MTNDCEHVATPKFEGDIFYDRHVPVAELELGRREQYCSWHGSKACSDAEGYDNDGP